MSIDKHFKITGVDLLYYNFNVKIYPNFFDKFNRYFTPKKKTIVDADFSINFVAENKNITDNIINWAFKIMNKYITEIYFYDKIAYPIHIYAI